jgi:CheY-like chemotaxis protein
MPENEGFILLAEDNDADAALLAAAFEAWGVCNPILRVRDGSEVISYLQGLEKYHDRYEFPLPGLILLDLHMPRLNGFGALGWIRSRREYDEIPVIFLTGTKEPTDVDKAYSLGAASFLEKTPDLEELKQGFEEVNVSILRPRYPKAVLRYGIERET